MPKATQPVRPVRLRLFKAKAFSCKDRQALDSLLDAQPTPHASICSLSTQELLASGLVSEVLKETRVNLGLLENRAMWGSRDPVDP